MTTPGTKKRVLMAETVDDYTNLSLQNLRYEIDFDPVNLSPDGSHYDFGFRQESRANGWQPLKLGRFDHGFYVVCELE